MEQGGFGKQTLNVLRNDTVPKEGLVEPNNRNVQKGKKNKKQQ